MLQVEPTTKILIHENTSLEDAMRTLQEDIKKIKSWHVISVNISMRENNLWCCTIIYDLIRRKC